MEITNVSIGRLKPNNYNPNKVTPKEYRNIKYSIETFGMVIPILAREKDGEYIIVDGEQRWRIAHEIGIKEIPVVFDEKNEDEERYKQLTIIMDEFRGNLDKDIVAKILDREREDTRELLKRMKIALDEDVYESKNKDFKKDIPDWDDSRVFTVDQDYDSQKIPYTLVGTEGEIANIKDYQKINEKIDISTIKNIWDHVSVREIDSDEKLFLMFQLALRRALKTPYMGFRENPEKPISIVYRDNYENVKKVVNYIENELQQRYKK